MDMLRGGGRLCKCSSVALLVLLSALLPEGEAESPRLSGNVIPVSYKLVWEPDALNGVLLGSVLINMKIKEPTHIIVLNSVNLSIWDVELVTSTARNKLFNMTIELDHQRVTFTFANIIPLGEATLSYRFKGRLREGTLQGFYLSRETDGRLIHVTQFEPIYARRAFPCFDDPALKATFNITLIVPKNLTALSNMDPISENEHPSNSALKVVHFNTTPRMSTYLVAAVISEFHFVEGYSTKLGTRLRVYTPPTQRKSGLKALQVAIKIVDALEEFLNTPQPITKIDLVPVTEFKSLAMENWGLITFQNYMLLPGPSTYSPKKSRDTIAHELVHQWFGNLVTLQWWNHTWLNEGVTTFLATLIIEKVYLDDTWLDFLNRLEPAINESQSKDTRFGHPMVESPLPESDAANQFDYIAYYKGGAIMRMVYHMIKEASLRDGLRLYLKRHAYGNVVSSDIWKALEESSGRPLAAMMSSWLFQAGHPLISVSSRINKSGLVLELQQEKMQSNANDIGWAGKKSLWVVPLFISSSAWPPGTIREFTMEGRNAEILIDGVSEDDWIMVNTNGVGVFRTMYSRKLLMNFGPAIKDKSLPVIDRFFLATDVMALVKCGYIQDDAALDFAQLYLNESTLYPLIKVGTLLTDLSSRNVALPHTVIQFYCDYWKTFMPKLTDEDRTTIQESFPFLWTAESNCSMRLDYPMKINNGTTAILNPKKY